MDVIGFYKTEEGRVLLRQTYPLYLAVSEIGDRKVATIIGDTLPTRVGRSKMAEKKEENEIEALRAALKRWAGGQSELWKDRSKNLRYLERLEREMMAVEDIRVIFELHAATDQKKALTNAFALFFHGAKQDVMGAPSVKEIRPKLLGLHEVYRQITHGDGSHDEPVITELRPDGTYIYFYEEPGLKGWLVHMFRLGRFQPEAQLVGEPAQSFRFRHSGFAYPIPSGDIHCMLAEHGPPGFRNHLILTPSSREKLVVWHGQQHPDDFVCVFTTVPNPHTGAWHLGHPYSEGQIHDGMRVLRRTDPMTERRITVSIQKLRWDVIL